MHRELRVAATLLSLLSRCCRSHQNQATNSMIQSCTTQSIAGVRVKQTIYLGPRLCDG